MINLQAPLNQLGYGQVGYNVALQFPTAHLSPIGKMEVFDNIDILQKMVNTPFYHNGHSLRIWHQHDLKSHIGQGRKIGWPIFELDTFTELELHNLSYCDLFVCSNWAREVCEKHGLNASVIPLGVDRDIFWECISNNENYTFITVGKWEVRKGHEQLISAFNHVFSEQDNVELWLCCHNPFCSEEQRLGWENLVKASKLADKIRIIPPQRTQQDLARLMRMADCGVFPSRAEGWGMPILEMMSCGKPVITTNYSAMTEYCDNHNSFLIPIYEVEPAYDGIWFNKQGNWAKFGSTQFEFLCDYMRELYKKRVNLNPAGVETAKKFSWENTANKILKNI